MDARKPQMDYTELINLLAYDHDVCRIEKNGVRLASFSTDLSLGHRVRRYPTQLRYTRRTILVNEHYVSFMIYNTLSTSR